jgi:hypothetical protein
VLVKGLPEEIREVGSSLMLERKESGPKTVIERTFWLESQSLGVLPKAPDAR